MSLTSQKCVPCQIGAKPVDVPEATRLLSELSPDWKLEEDKKLRRTLVFKDFQEALDFIVKVGEIAEQQGHHPEIRLHDYKKVTIEWWTHKIDGLHQNDFIMAAKTDQLYTAT